MRPMQRAGLIAIILVALLAAAAMAARPGMEVRTVAAPSVVEVKSSLVGVVLADGLVAEGVEVADGQPLVFVQTATRSLAVAATAPRDGVVVAVLVQPGQKLQRGQVIVRLSPK